ncbi:MAG: menaquinone biosynthesis family protein [Wolinella sp.]
MRKITVAHSPDADDIFMYYALKFGWVSDKGFCFNNEALDIQTLNERACEGIYDVSAISFALYPRICDSYALLRTGVSFGEGYGPKLIKKRGKHLKRNFKVALSGRYTSNALLFSLAYPDARIVYKNFLEIESAVLNDEVDAGVLIHESILHFDDSLEVEREVWDIWLELAKESLPLPLGGMGIRRSIPLYAAIEIESLLTRAVELARQHPAMLSKMLHERALLRVCGEELERYLSLYANDHSISMSDEQLRALDVLFALGYERGIYSERIEASECLIPREYAELRKS